MSDTKFLISTRKYIRIQVTRLFNDRKMFSSLNLAEKSAKKVQLRGYVEELKSLDSKIQAKLWEENGESEDILLKEINDCEGYNEKINVMLGCLDQSPTPASNSDNVDTARSLLKSPVAPLPVFNSKDM